MHISNIMANVFLIYFVVNFLRCRPAMNAWLAEYLPRPLRPLLNVKCARHACVWVTIVRVWVSGLWVGGFSGWCGRDSGSCGYDCGGEGGEAGQRQEHWCSRVWCITKYVYATAAYNYNAKCRLGISGSLSRSLTHIRQVSASVGGVYAEGFQEQVQEFMLLWKHWNIVVLSLIKYSNMNQVFYRNLFKIFRHFVLMISV